MTDNNDTDKSSNDTNEAKSAADIIKQVEKSMGNERKNALKSLVTEKMKKKYELERSIKQIDAEIDEAVKKFEAGL